MRVCLLSREFPPDTGWGGVGTYTYQIAHGLAALGHEVHVVALAKEGAPDSCTKSPAGFTVHRAQWHGLLDELNILLIFAPTLHFVSKTGLALWKRFLQLHTQQPFHVVEAPEHLAAGLFNSLARTAPLVVKLHTPHSKFISDNYNNVLPSFEHQMVALFERTGIVESERVCSPSVDIAKFVASDSGMPLDEIAIVRNPIDSTRFTPDGNKTHAQPGKLNVLFVGRLEQRKGIDYLIQTVPQVSRAVPNARFLIVGADTDTAPGGGSMAEHLKKQLVANGSESAVEFIPHVPLDELPAIYRSADVCVIPSIYDNAPYTCLEAMSSGRPVIVSDAGGTHEYVLPGTTGIVVPTRDAEALASAITDLLLNQEKRHNMGANARQYVSESLDRNVIAGQMESLYQEAVCSYEPKKKLYKKEPAQLLTDAVQLLCSLDAELTDTMYVRSTEFRIKHYLRFLRTRPTLFVAKLILSLARQLQLQKLPPFKAPIERLSAAIASRQGVRYAEALRFAQLEPDEHESTPLQPVQDRLPVSPGRK